MFKSLVLHHKFPLLITAISWLTVGYFLGFSGFFLVIVLSLLEITLSADNAVVNSKVLIKMSPIWQKLFMTIGIFIAVFLIRFALPIVLVAVASQTSANQILDLALRSPSEYGEKLHQVAPVIDGFGGMFLFIVATFFFVDFSRAHFWVYNIEKQLSRVASVPFIKVTVIGLLFLLVVALLPESQKATVAAAMALAAAVYLSLHAITRYMEKFEQKNKLKKQVGWAAFASFMYLEVLDASFSLDGVVGAFALTNNIVIIMVGLGVGALWVRTLTLYMVKHKTLAEYQYLESGAHWAILFLSFVMFLKLFHVELPEIIVGSIGLVSIGLSVYSSVVHNRKTQKKVAA